MESGKRCVDDWPLVGEQVVCAVPDEVGEAHVVCCKGRPSGAAAG